MTCNNCGHIQDSGKFCGRCGNSLDENAESAATIEQPNEMPVVQVAPTQPETNPSLEKVKDTSSQYFNYFKTHLKNPSTVFTNVNGSPINGIVSWLIFIVITGLITYSAVDAFIQFIILQEMEFEQIIPPSYFMTIFTRASLFAAIITGTIIFILFGLINLFIRPITIKWVTQVYGTILIPAILISSVTWLLILLGSYTVAFVTFSFTLSLVLFILPIIVLYQTARNTEPKIDRVYLGLIYSVVYTIASYILYFIILESTFMKFTRYIQDIMYYF